MIHFSDFSFIGVFLAAWHVVLIAWGWICRAFNWLFHHALALFIGSKFWATSAYLTAALAIIGLYSRFLTFVTDQISDFVVDSLTPDSSVLGFIFLYIPAHDLLSTFTTASGCLAAYIAVVNLDFVRRALVGLFDLLSKAFKT